MRLFEMDSSSNTNSSIEAISTKLPFWDASGSTILLEQNGISKIQQKDEIHKTTILL
jgi:hypothetical protein